MQVLKLVKRTSSKRGSEGVTISRPRKNGLILAMYRADQKYLSVFLDSILSKHGIKKISDETLEKELKKIHKEVTA